MSSVSALWDDVTRTDPIDSIYVTVSNLQLIQREGLTNTTSHVFPVT